MSVPEALKSAVKQLPGIREIVLERDRLKSDLIARDKRESELMEEQNRLLSELAELKAQLSFAPPGHFYSPIPDLKEIARDESRIFGPAGRTIPGIDLRESEQLALLQRFIPYYHDMPFQSHKTEQLRYYFDNPSYSYSDAILLYCMIRFLRPKKILEVGSGFSSCVTLDTNEFFFGGSIATTFVEPYPALLQSLLKEGDRDDSRIRLIPARLQDVDLAEFGALEPNDILFIDSTHVSKIDSDVNRLFFDILPRLAPGVYVHLHDIFYPFEYPKEWIYEGRAWTEAYVLRAFMQYNAAFRIVLMNTFMEHFHDAFFRQNMPLCQRNPGGSIWIRKVTEQEDLGPEPYEGQRP